MEALDVTQEIIDLRERVTRNESSIVSLIHQQTAIDNLVTAVQELALQIKEITINQQGLCDKIQTIEDKEKMVKRELKEDRKYKQRYIWTAVVGGIIGIVLVKIAEKILG